MTPKRSTYAASEDEKTNASIALATKKEFDTFFMPLIEQRAEESRKEELMAEAEGVTGADVMQTLTGDLSFPSTRGMEVSSMRTLAAIDSAIKAQGTGYLDQTKSQVDVLKLGKGIQTDVASNFRYASRIGTSDQLQAGRREVSATNAQFQYIGKPAARIAGSYIYDERVAAAEEAEAQKDKEADAEKYSFDISSSTIGRMT